MPSGIRIEVLMHFKNKSIKRVCNVDHERSSIAAHPIVRTSVVIAWDKNELRCSSRSDGINGGLHRIENVSIWHIVWLVHQTKQDLVVAFEYAR